MWEVEYTDEFEAWWETLSIAEQDAVDYSVGLLENEGRPLRTFYAFDPRRIAILLIGGDKTGDDRFYDTMVPVADKIYDVYLKEIQEEKDGKKF
ncbi:MAG: type II toxin-antitoxin system RelE/ParE family toxin [Treponema sp.]|nr:type II toxin-antitoxin system RelE/ParE family toxin [Treponema sp.]